jgi:hypothetical protein
MLSRNRNFYKLRINMRRIERKSEIDFFLKSSHTFYDKRELVSIKKIVNVINGDITFKSQDILNFNDLNFAKVYFFLNRLLLGVFRENRIAFKFRKPNISTYSQRNKKLTEVRSGNTPYNFIRNFGKNEIFGVIIYLIYFLRPFSKQKQITVRTNYSRNRNMINISFLDMTLLAAGSSAFHFFHDFFDWNKAQLLWRIELDKGINNDYEKLLYFYYFSSFFRIGVNKTAVNFNF